MSNKILKFFRENNITFTEISDCEDYDFKYKVTVDNKNFIYCYIKESKIYLLISCVNKKNMIIADTQKEFIEKFKAFMEPEVRTIPDDFKRKNYEVLLCSPLPLDYIYLSAITDYATGTITYCISYDNTNTKVYFSLFEEAKREFNGIIAQYI